MIDAEKELQGRNKLTTLRDVRASYEGMCQRASLVVDDGLSRKLMKAHGRKDMLFPHARINILQNGLLEPKESVISEQTNSIVTNNLQYTTNNYNLKLERKEIELLKKKFSTNINNNYNSYDLLLPRHVPFEHSQIQKSLGVLTPGLFQESLLKSEIFQIRERNVAKTTNREHVIRDVTDNERLITSLTRNYQKLEQRINQISSSEKSNVKSFFDEQSAELVSVILKALGQVGVEEEVIKNLRVACKRKKNSLKRISRVIRQTSNVFEQVNLLMQTSKSGENSSYVARNLMTVIVEVVKQQVEKLQKEIPGEVQRRREGITDLRRINANDLPAQRMKVESEKFVLVPPGKFVKKGQKFLKTSRVSVSFLSHISQLSDVSVLNEEHVNKLLENELLKRETIQNKKKLDVKVKTKTSKLSNVSVLNEEHVNKLLENELLKRETIQRRKKLDVKVKAKTSKLSNVSVLNEEHVNKLLENELLKRETIQNKKLDVKAGLRSKITNEIHVVEREILAAAMTMVSVAPLKDSRGNFEKFAKLLSGGERQKRQADYGPVGVGLKHKSDFVLGEIQQEIQELRKEQVKAGSRPTRVEGEKRVPPTKQESPVLPKFVDDKLPKLVEKGATSKVFLSDHINDIVDRVYLELENRLKVEQYKMGLF
ncbi:MAG: hypothetical protein LBB04_03220 [Oscillospiraceae bacterium]|jgi:hypothetical protein|nr:hypothetical protein [Oscillospiraceae bacterium]